jgi:hypothetical protein
MGSVGRERLAALDVSVGEESMHCWCTKLFRKHYSVIVLAYPIICGKNVGWNIDNGGAPHNPVMGPPKTWLSYHMAGIKNTASSQQNGVQYKRALNEF